VEIFLFWERNRSFCVILSSPSWGMSAFRLVRASGLPPSFPRRNSILKSKPLRTSLDVICCSVSSFVVVNLIRFLWSVRTRKC